MNLANSGIEALGDIKWGSHFCHFYHGNSDLVETLVPFFKAGLENNEQCLWITSEPLVASDARALLKNAVPALEKYERKGQIEIYNYTDWYLKTGKTDADSTVQSWVDRQSHALEQGRTGLRLTGNTYWLERPDWDGFKDYEKKVNDTFSKHRIIGLCSYCLKRTIATDVFDVARNHDFTLLRQDGQWELLESAQIKQSKDHLQKLNLELKENLKSAKDAAESASRLKTAFIANMSHEIRTPLGAILGFAELLKDPQISADEKKTFVETIERNGKSLSRLLDDILDLSKVEADRLDIENTNFSLPNLMNEVVWLFTQKVEKKGTSIRVEYGRDVPSFIHSDATRIRQIAINLIGNAVKFTDQGEVQVRISKETGEDNISLLQISVTDTGVGIAPEHRRFLFQPFTQADNSITRKYGGSGLGLYISRKLAHGLGGDVFLENSTPGEGSTFIARIKFQPAKTAESATVIPITEKQGRSVLEGINILVVDDTSDNQALVRLLLKPTGANITLASDGQEGIEQATRNEFDIILMDLQMPNVDGYQAMKTLRRKGFTKPILALTAHAMKEEREHALASGFDDHIAKPIDKAQFIAKLEKFKRDLH